MFPNPVSNVLTIEGKELRRISVYSVLGVKLYECETSNERVQIDLSAYSKGMYLVNVLSDEGVSTVKVMKR